MLSLLYLSDITLGETALAGVSVAYPLTQLSTGLGSLIGVGAGSVLSIAIGRQDKATQERLLGNVNYLTIIVTVVYTVLGLIFSTSLLKMMGGEGAAWATNMGMLDAIILLYVFFMIKKEFTNLRSQDKALAASL